jgi:hypothetical protein
MALRSDLPAASAIPSRRVSSSWSRWGNGRDDRALYGRVEQRLRGGWRPVRPDGRQPAPVDPQFGVQLQLWRFGDGQR